ncbi:lipopolysaccharide kinase InaA family protein [Parahaliea mediterranea]|uniref:Phosphotransferase n=1 Tax=Parahaliea mediterranea TaxID=651086 RepID=A0A939INY6_9GAMM|nr:lipopolysaccharide kinase InaA family protein [Parahaliea mediterranea]MBN7799035.1 phosphotransferase [Parahaliea mediterranea]
MDTSAQTITRESADGTDLEHIARQLAGRELPAGWESVASSAHDLVARNPAAGLYYKEYTARSLPGRLGARLGLGVARRARRNSARLALAGFTAPQYRGLGVLENGREYVFVDALAGESVSHWLRLALGDRDPATLALRRALLRELGTFIGRLHAAGFLHGDLRSDNVLATYKGGQFRFALINNEHGSLRRPPPGTGLLADLAALSRLPASAATRADRWRCFLAWRRQHPELGHEEARLLAVEAYRRRAKD